MKFLVNAISCRVAGGRTVALNFLRCYREGDFEHDLAVYAPANCGYEELESDNVKIQPVHPIVHFGPARLWVDNVWSRQILERERPDALFALGSIPYPTDVPQLVLYHWPYAIYPDREVWDRMSFRDQMSRRVRRWLFARRRARATAFAAQTETARSRLERLWGLDNVSVVPNAVSVHDSGASGPPPCLPKGAIPPGHRALLCLSRYYPHKNIEILVDVGERLRDRGAPFVILTTLDARDGAGVGATLERIEQRGLGEVIVNLGTVPTEEVPALYAATDGLILPTLVESFSGTYVEAMHYNRPVFTSDRDFAHDVCGDVAWYFDPHDTDDILRAIDEAFSDDAERQRRLELGRKRCAEFADWPEVTQRYVQLLEEVGSARPPA